MILRYSAVLVALLVAPGVTVSAADAASGPSAGGCINQTVANGPWRIRVTKIVPIHRRAPYPDIPATGWGIYLDWTNASARRLTDTGAANWELAFPSGKALGIFDYAKSTDLSKKSTGVLSAGEDQTGVMDAFTGLFAPGARRRAEIKFWYPADDANFRGHPTKLIISGESYLTTHFGTALFLLTCKK